MSSKGCTPASRRWVLRTEPPARSARARISPSTIVAVALVFVTGFVVGQLLAPALVVQPSSSARERSNENAAGMFYEAIDHYLEFGDSAKLLNMLDPGFVDHSAVDPQQDAASLLRYFGAMRATYPDMRIEVARMVPRDDLVAVSLTTSAGTATNTGGVVSDRPASAPGYEQLRIVNGKIAERWASETLPPRYELFASLDLRHMAGWFVECAVETLMIMPGDSETRRHFSPALLIASSGEIALEIEPKRSPHFAQLLTSDPGSPIALQRGTRIDLQNQSVVILPEGEAFHVWNTGTQAASIIVVRIHHQSPVTTLHDDQSPFGDPNSESGSLLASGLLPMGTDPDRPYNLSLVRVAAAPNELLAVHSVSGFEHLIVVAGSLEVETHDKQVAVSRLDEQTMAAPGDLLRLLPGEGVSVTEGTLMSYRVAAGEPAALWIISLTRATRTPG